MPLPFSVQGRAVTSACRPGWKGHPTNEPSISPGYGGSNFPWIFLKLSASHQLGALTSVRPYTDWTRICVQRFPRKKKRHIWENIGHTTLDWKYIIVSLCLSTNISYSVQISHTHKNKQSKEMYLTIVYIGRPTRIVNIYVKNVLAHCCELR